MHTRLLVAALTVISVALTLLAWPARDASAVAPDRQYVGYLRCGSPSLSAGFILPGVTDVRSTLSNRGVSGDPDAMWIDLSIVDNDFAPDTFLNAGPFTPSADGQLFSWFDLTMQKTHFYRLNAHVGTRWVELGRGSFETPDCFGLVNQIVCDRGSGTNLVGFALPFMEAQLPPGVPARPQLTALQSWLDLACRTTRSFPARSSALARASHPLRTGGPELRPVSATSTGGICSIRTIIGTCSGVARSSRCAATVFPPCRLQPYSRAPQSRPPAARRSPWPRSPPNVPAARIHTGIPSNSQ